jgi:hypothetical protein
MKERLVETFRMHEQVEIYLKTFQGDAWYLGRVIQFDHPGIWVEIEEGSQWFVTNRGRIRRAAPDG